MRDQFIGQQQSFGRAAARKFLDHVQFLRVNRDREVGGQCPRCGRPDRDAGFVFPIAARDWKFHVNSGVIAFLILHFGFGERGLGTGAPENWFLRLINQTLLNKDRERAQDFRFVFGIERQIGMLPIAEDAEAFELRALKIDILARERIAPFAHFQRRQIARFLDDFVFDR